MTASSLLADLAAWSAQVACIAVAGPLPAVLRLDAPGVRYAYFRALLAICLVLPWLQGRHVVPAATATSDFTSVLIGVPMNTDTTVTPGFPWVAVLETCLVLGIAMRGVWIVLGLLRLERLRMAGIVLPWQKDHDDLQRIRAS
jgi:hypothetical protein